MAFHNLASIHDRRQAAVAQCFRENAGERALLLTDAFPFLIIGTIRDVLGDVLLLEVETTQIMELEGRVMRVHIEDIEVFHIEDDGTPIPRIH